MASPGSDGDIRDERLFDGVRFVLVGFESETESMFRTEMVRRGGADASRSGKGFTHVIVWNRFYDDPCCVVARAEGKKVVTDLWVEDSLDRGVLADADRVLYWPVRDANGIPGAQSLHICLTGYQRNCREDIMRMVCLMGAQFSKALKPNLITHLICYKFEGEKYDVAKQVDIKLVNHRWLEDCLKAWEILPVDGYSKSSWELELIEAQVINDSENEAEDAGQISSNNKSSVRHTPNSKICAETFARPDVNAPTRPPIIPSDNEELLVESHLNTPGHVMKTVEEDRETHDITGQGIPKVDVFAPVQTSFVLTERRENAAVRNTKSLNPIQEAEENYICGRTLDTTNGILSTPNSSKMTVFGNSHLGTSNGIPDNLDVLMDNVSGKHLVNHDQIEVTNDLLTSSLVANHSLNELDSSKVDRWQHQEKDEPSAYHTPAADQSNVDDKPTDHDSNEEPGFNFMSKNMKDPSNSKNASWKSSLLEGHSVNHMTSPQRVEESTLRVDSNIFSREMGRQGLIEHAEIQSVKGNEKMNSVDGQDGASAQKRKNLAPPASLNLQKEDLDAEPCPLDSPFLGRLSDASEPTTVSSAGTNPAEANAVYSGKQQSSLSTSRQSRSRKPSIPLCGSVSGIKLPGNSSCGNNGKSQPKARTSLKRMTENKCTMSPTTVQNGKTSPGLSFPHKDGEDAQASGNAANQSFLHSMHETGNVLTKDSAHDIPVRSPFNSQAVSCSGNADLKVTDSLNVDNEVAVASNFKLEKVVSDTNVREDTKQFRDTSSTVQGETSYSKKIAISIERNAGTKRPRCASTVPDGSIVNNGKKTAPESPAEVIPNELADPTSKNGCTTACAAELKTMSPNKAPISGMTNTIANRTRKGRARIDAWVSSNMEFSANADERKRNSPKKLPNTRVTNTVAKKSRKSDTNMSNEMLVDKTESVAAGSLFDDMFASDNVEDCPKKLSSCASASDCGTLSPKNIANTRVRNAVAKRKIKAVEDNSGSKCGKIGNAIASAAKAVSSRTIQEISCNINKVKDSDKSNKDVMRDVSGLSHQDSATVDKQQGPHNSKSRSRKQKKGPTSGHEKENTQDHSNLNSKSNAKTGSLCSRFDAKSMQKSTHILSEHQRMIKGSESGSVITSEPALFILSGNRQQRSEYQSILRRLKGRVCRHSHHWSYQATHFIAPDPLRRTEKFFAAAAAGRWILKRDYLTACHEAGKFVDEEAFEWFGIGLSDGETISFDAPRKWRIIRQQTGHGAFYGMQIVVYGQLILPTLDTVKRAVKAGDGTILATSPPYTRFLDSGVDFAVVSSSIPRADAWVQEFIRHGIPCVSADYLVEYVCKPGHPLVRHVLFKTNDLANKSLEKLMKNQHEVATENVEPSEDEEDDPEDLSCSACGSKDRGEVMLICGDEDGETGCGIGMHIDCCDPPLDAVPDEDWLCPKCAVPISKTKRKATTTRGTGRKTRRR